MSYSFNLKLTCTYIYIMDATHSTFFLSFMHKTLNNSKFVLASDFGLNL